MPFMGCLFALFAWSSVFLREESLPKGKSWFVTNCSQPILFFFDQRVLTIERMVVVASERENNRDGKDTIRKYVSSVESIFRQNVKMCDESRPIVASSERNCQ